MALADKSASARHASDARPVPFLTPKRQAPTGTGPAQRAGKLWLALIPLAAVHSLVMFAGFFAPEDYAEQDRTLPLAPPSRLHFVDPQGRFHVVPFVYRIVPPPARPGDYLEDQSRVFPIGILVRGTPYRVAGIFTSRRHLFGVEAPAKIFLLGRDEYGRDQLSRLLYGGRVSLFAGLLAAVLSVTTGALLGACAGFYGGWLDGALMRFSELFLALPWLYLLLAVRAFLPLRVSPSEALLLAITIVGLVGWARPARLVRGVVLSARGRNYVLAARGFGARQSSSRSSRCIRRSFSNRSKYLDRRESGERDLDPSGPDDGRSGSSAFLEGRSSGRAALCPHGAKARTRPSVASAGGR